MAALGGGGENSTDIKEAIIDLYLAIKIRSTEELDAINDDALKSEKQKLMDDQDAFQVLEYIRSSIEIIMNLKIDDLEKGSARKSASEHSQSMQQSMTSVSLANFSVASNNLILQSMKDALAAMISSRETQDAVEKTKQGAIPRPYERIIQKLEADIRGHIRLEHEMKIHMDYLEGKTEKLEREAKASDAEHAALQSQVDSLQGKMKLLREDRDEKDAVIRKQRDALQEMREKVKLLEGRVDTLKNERMSTAAVSQVAGSSQILSQAETLLIRQSVLPGTTTAAGLEQQPRQYNSIDIGNDMAPGQRLAHAKWHTNTNISHKKRALQQQ